MSLAFIPVYIKFLGIESYGLIGFFASFQSLLALLDLGLGAAISRELARLSVDVANAAQMRQLLRTLELIYWGVGLLLAGIIVLIAPLLATHWLQPESISSSNILHAIILMGAGFAARWPFGLYSGVLQGLQRQVLFNGVKIFVETARNGGAALVLWLVSPSLTAFLWWQFAISLIASMFTAAAAWHAMPASMQRSQFSIDAMRGIWKFAAGLSGIALTVVVLTQIDKVILSKMLSLKAFGFYALAWTLASGLGLLISPVFAAYYPRLVQAVMQTGKDDLKHIYHQGCQLVSIIVLPAGAVIAGFSHEILLLWTQNAEVAQSAHLVLRIVIIGSMLNGLMNIPYALQLAHGWTSLAFKANIVAICFLAPLVIFAAYRYGVEGAASIWVLLNTGYILFSIHWQHKCLLPAEKRSWYWNDVIPPLFASALAVIVMRAIIPEMDAKSPLLTLVAIMIAYFFCLFSVAMALPRYRTLAFAVFR